MKTSPTPPNLFKQHPSLECLIYAILAAALGFGWQSTLVHTLYGGNWSALFYHGRTGSEVTREPVFASTYVFPDELGFDGQDYRIVAHDPFLNRGYYRYIARPVMRYRRILVPFLAFALAFGHQPYIDAGYIATMLLFLSLGVYWLARYAVLFGRSAKWGWAFLLAPATLAGLERGSIDTALTALTIGFALYLREHSRFRLFLVLVMAGLCRETGLLLILACAGSSLLKKSWTTLGWSCASMLPALAWYGYLRMYSPPDPGADLLRLPLTDFFQSLLHHDVSYINNGAPLVLFAYYVAICGVILAFSLSFWLSFHGWIGAEGLAALAFTMTGLLLQPAGLWVQAYHFGRVLAPLLVLLALDYFPARDWRKLLPACMVTPAILLVSAASALRVAKHLAI